MRHRLTKALSPWRLRIERGELPLVTGRPAVLVVSHEASATGAPILSLNLGETLAADHTVLQLVLGLPGPLSPELRRHSHWLIHSGEPSLSAAAWRHARALLPRQLAIRFAVVNSVVAFPALETLRRQGIAGLCLVHEFAAYIRPPLAPRQACLEAALWAHRLVFSAAITRDDALKHWPALRDTPLVVLPQGQSRPPEQPTVQALKPGAENNGAAEPPPAGLAPLADRLSPNTTIVLGAGAVQPRKGLDLFIAMARQLENRSPDPQRLYVWLGSGYRPESDLMVSVWLQDQIERSGLSGQLQILEAPQAYGWLMQRCALFVLSSRLDPLPNVAIDAALAGRPVLAFAQASGMAELLADDPALAPHCLAPYLDTAVMAEQAAAILSNQALAAQLSEATLALGRRHFRMDHYVELLLALGEDAANALQQEETELERLLTCPGALDVAFHGLPRRWSHRHLLHHYLRQWRSRIVPRKPQPGFHPGIYAEQVLTTDTNSDPLLHWLQAGQPDGPWRQPLITPNDPRPAATEAPVVGVHLHVHYPELLEPILAGLRHNRLEPHLVISVSDPDLERDLGLQLARQGLELLAFRCVPNRGRDLGPLLDGIGALLEQHTSIYAHLHTKRSPAVAAAVVERWRRFLLDQLLGTAAVPMADRIVARLQADPGLGLVFPDDPAAIGWDANRPAAEALADRLGLGALPEQIQVPVGSMFWARRGALTALYNLNWGPETLPPEPLPHDGTVLHALERLLPLVSAQAGLRTAICHVPGLSR